MPTEPMALDLYAVADYLDGIADCRDERKRAVAAYLRAKAARRVRDMDATPARGAAWGGDERMS